MTTEQRRELLGLRDLPEEFAEAQRASWASLSPRALLTLDNLENSSVRKRAYAVRDAARHVHPSHRCASCGWSNIGTVGITERKAGGYALASVATCGSVWTCAPCALIIKGKRAEQIKEGVALHRQHYGAESMLLLTFTIRHQEGDSLAYIAEHFQEAWNMYQTRIPTLTKAARSQARALGLGEVPTPDESIEAVGGVYGAEVTHGGNGWHYHRHQVLACERNLAPPEIELYAAACKIWWRECVIAKMGERFAPSIERGFDARRLNVADYIAKLGLEISDVGTKQARNGSETPWGVMLRAATRDQQAADLLMEYALAMRGKKAIQFGERLLYRWRALGLVVEDDEERLADESEGQRLVVELPGAVWRVLRFSGLVAHVLEATTEEELAERLGPLLPEDFEPEWGGWGDGSRIEQVEREADEARERRAIRDASGGHRRTKQERRAAQGATQRAYWSAVDSTC